MVTTKKQALNSPANPTLPWMVEGLRLLGTKEDMDGSNDEIVGWAEDFEGWVAKYYDTDDIPWCGLYVGHCVVNGKCSISFDNILYALNWRTFGLKLREACYGAILVFKRDGGGHVGFYVSEDEDYYHVLGGNQSNMVSIKRVAKDRCVAIRWPKEYKDSIVPGKIIRKLNAEITTNEA